MNDERVADLRMPMVIAVQEVEHEAQAVGSAPAAQDQLVRDVVGVLRARRGRDQATAGCRRSASRSPRTCRLAREAGDLPAAPRVASACRASPDPAAARAPSRCRPPGRPSRGRRRWEHRHRRSPPRLRALPFVVVEQAPSRLPIARVAIAGRRLFEEPDQGGHAERDARPVAVVRGRFRSASPSAGSGRSASESGDPTRCRCTSEKRPGWRAQSGRRPGCSRRRAPDSPRNRSRSRACPRTSSRWCGSSRSIPAGYPPGRARGTSA